LQILAAYSSSWIRDWDFVVRNPVGSCFDNFFVSQFEISGEEEPTENGGVVWEVELGGFY